ncbi:MAG TPA: DUF5069 domain-containing protein [Coleofasciculaceae cyanobacterium]|jgi:hypothetical protein
MSTATVSDKLKSLAKDLTKDFPRSPRETLGGYVIAGRTLDKCRSTLAGINGEYHFNCALDKIFFEFAGISAEDFQNFVATGATDEEVGAWITQHGKTRERIELVKWNNQWRYTTIRELPDGIQLYLEDYIPQVIPKGRVIYHFFDVYDIEEKRL